MSSSVREVVYFVRCQRVKNWLCGPQTSQPQTSTGHHSKFFFKCATTRIFKKERELNWRVPHACYCVYGRSPRRTIKKTWVTSLHPASKVCLSDSLYKNCFWLELNAVHGKSTGQSAGPNNWQKTLTEVIWRGEKKRTLQNAGIFSVFTPVQVISSEMFRNSFKVDKYWCVSTGKYICADVTFQKLGNSAIRQKWTPVKHALERATSSDFKKHAVW